MHVWLSEDNPSPLMQLVHFKAVQLEHPGPNIETHERQVGIVELEVVLLVVFEFPFEEET
jgi:hypothetical protein